MKKAKLINTIRTLSHGTYYLYKLTEPVYYMTKGKMGPYKEKTNYMALNVYDHYVNPMLGLVIPRETIIMPVAMKEEHENYYYVADLNDEALGEDKWTTGLGQDIKKYLKDNNYQLKE